MSSSIHQHFIFQTIASKKSNTLSEQVLINALQFISSKIINFVNNNAGLSKVANKEEVVAAAETLKGKIDEVFRELDTAASGDEDETDDDLRSLLEEETQAPGIIAESEEVEVESPAKAARVRSPSPIKKVAMLRASSPTPSISASSVESLNITGIDYGMTTDEMQEGEGFLFVASNLPSDRRERHSGKIANKVMLLSTLFIQTLHFTKINTSFYRLNTP